ncbi:MAG: PIN domain-containing protein [Nitrospiria bacterium]
MSGRYLLDTNIIIALFSEDQKIHQNIANASEIFIPSIAIGELYFGAFKSVRMKENHARIDEFTQNSAVLSCDIETAKKYGNIKNRLKEKGRPIPENDLWIAAIAQQYGLTLVSRDTHFDNVEDLQVEVW